MGPSHPPSFVIYSSVLSVKFIDLSHSSEHLLCPLSNFWPSLNLRYMCFPGHMDPTTIGAERQSPTSGFTSIKNHMALNSRVQEQADAGLVLPCARAEARSRHGERLGLEHDDLRHVSRGWDEAVARGLAGDGVADPDVMESGTVVHRVSDSQHRPGDPRPQRDLGRRSRQRHASTDPHTIKVRKSIDECGFRVRPPRKLQSP